MREILRRRGDGQAGQEKEGRKMEATEKRRNISFFGCGNSINLASARWPDQMQHASPKRQIKPRIKAGWEGLLVLHSCGQGCGCGDP